MRGDHFLTDVFVSQVGQRIVNEPSKTPERFPLADPDTAITLTAKRSHEIACRARIDNHERETGHRECLADDSVNVFIAEAVPDHE